MTELPDLPPLGPLSRPAPEGALDGVIARGRRRRQRFVGVAGGGMTAILVVVLALTTTGGPAGRDTVVPTDDVSPTASAGPTATTANTVAATAPASPAAPGESPSALAQPAQPTSPEPNTTAVPVATQAADRPGFREQTDEDAPGDTVCATAKTPVAGSCSYSSEPDPVLRRGQTARFTEGSCSNATTSSTNTYSFQGGQETEVLVTKEGREVYRFSDTVRYLDGAHQRRERPGHCLEYANAWNGRLTDGRPAPAGTYDVVFTVRWADAQTTFEDGSSLPADGPGSYEATARITVVD